MYKPTTSQRLIWLDQLISKGSAKYNIGGYASLTGDLIYEYFQEAIRYVFRSQDVYSWVFSADNGELEAREQPAADNYTMDLIDLSTEPDPEKASLQWMEKDFANAFEIEGNHLFHFVLIRVSNQKHFWYARIHHLISDGWSFKLLLNQAAAFYSSLCRKEEIRLTVYRYNDYSADDAEYYLSQPAADDRAFWLNEYAELPPALFQGLQEANYEVVAGSETLQIDGGAKEKLFQIANEGKVSLFHLVAALLIIYFGRTTGQDIIAMGVPVLNRSKKAYKQTAGVFMNLLSLKFEYNETSTLSDLLNAVRQKMSVCLRHQRYQYGNLVKDLNLQRSRKLLYDLRISYEDFEFTSDFGGLNAEAVALSNHDEVDPLAIYVREYHGKGFDIRFIYNTEYFSPQRIQSICRSLKYMMSVLPENMNTPINRIPLFGEDERKKILKLSTGRRRRLVQTGFAETWAHSVMRYPTNTAITFKGRDLSYLAVDRSARKIAQGINSHHQKAGKGVIALVLGRSERMIIGMLGSILSGTPYVPIDPEYPAHRIKYMLNDAGCTLILTDVGGRGILSGQFTAQLLDIDEILNIQDDPEALMTIRPSGNEPCYIIYTSGSTGNPKGVVIAHHSLTDYVATFVEFFKVKERDVVLQQASISFDTSVEEIFPVLAAGGKLCILENPGDLADLVNTLHSGSVSILSSNPWVIRYLNTQVLPPCLRSVISGGDVLKAEYIQNLSAAGISVYNTYGPTESTVCATYYKVKKEDMIIPIGKPIAGRKVYIADTHEGLQPIGAEGEIYIGGRGLAKKYLNMPDLTTEKFIADPFSTSGRVYKTGDRGVMTEEGNIIFRGRVDAQVNFRGYRIETGEIEMAINAQTGVENSIVAVKLIKEVPILVAFIKYKSDVQRPAREWKQLLGNRLPSYMVPQVWIGLKEMPLLPNGKVNRNDLPPIGSDIFPKDDPPEAELLSPVGKVLHAIWKDILKLENIGADVSFFEAGGHSLNIVQLVTIFKAKFGIRVGIRDLFERDTIRKQAEFVEMAAPVWERGDADDPIAGQDLPLTHAQERIWILSQLEEAAIAYNISGAIKLTGSVDKDLVGRAIATIIERHESLRTLFIESETGSLGQRILAPGEVHAGYHEYIGSLPNEGGLPELLRGFTGKPFDLAKAPLIRSALIWLSTGEHLLLCVMPHIISDGWSMEVLLRDFAIIYRAFESGKTPPLLPLERQFKDHINRINRHADDADTDGESMWLQRMQSKLPVVDLPAQYPRPAVKTYVGSAVERHFDKVHYDRLKGFCESEKSTLFMGLMAILNLLIHRYTGQDATMIGTPIANRDEPGLDDQVGLYLNMLPVRTDLKGSMSFRNLLLTQKTQLLQAYTFHRYPMEKIIHKPGYRNDPSRSPLFDILIVLHNQQTPDNMREEDPKTGIPGLKMDLYNDLPRFSSQFDMSFCFFYDRGSIMLRLEYNTDLFEDWFAEQMAGHFIGISKQVLDNPDIPVSRIGYLSAKENLNLTTAILQPYEEAEYKSVMDGFLSEAGRLASQVAVVCGTRRYTYTSLLEAARRGAHYLINIKGVTFGDRVGMMIEPDERLPACLLAIWMSGAVYVPVNPSYPLLRQQTIIADADCRLVIKEEELEEMMISRDPGGRFQGRAYPIAYIIYTSGTTGVPKGVIISHEALSKKMSAELKVILRNEPINSCLITNYCFDVSFLELLLPLLTGGKVVIPEAGMVYQQESLASLLIKENVNVLHGTPTFMDSFFRYLSAARSQRLNEILRVVCIGGESLYAALVDLLKEQIPATRINNQYGPTEAVIHAIVKEDIGSFERNMIGKPMTGVQAYVLDVNLQLVPRGVTGELHIGGNAAIADGYWNNEDATEAKFIKNRFSGKDKLYKTGDLVRWTNDMELEFIGRTDAQVKIRGFRIEPDEIQRAMERYPGVNQAVIATYPQAGSLSLIAFMTGGKLIDEKGVRAHLQRYLPEYMVPALLIQVGEIPLNENGKADKDRLLAGVDLSRNRPTAVVPRNDSERWLAALWGQLLNISPIGVTDNFFELGGNSILLIKMRFEINKQMGIHLNIRELLNLSTIEVLAQLIDALQWLHTDEKTPENQNLQEFTV